MSSDDDHGSQGRYPEGWSPENHDVAPSTAPNKPYETAEALPSDTDTSEEIVVDELQEDGDDLEELEFGDDPAAASEYECAECESQLKYHQEECSCGQNPMWRVPAE